MDPRLLADVLPVFAAEAGEQLEVLGALVLALERAPGDADLAESIRRTAHTLKGSAASLGFGEIERLAHAIEDAVREAPQAERAAGAVQAVLAALDAVDASIRAGGAPIPDVPRLVAALEHASPEAPRAPAPPEPARTPAATALADRVAALEERLVELRAPTLENRAAKAAAAARAAGEVAASTTDRMAELGRALCRSFEALAVAGPDLARTVMEAAEALVELGELAASSPAVPPPPDPADAPGAARPAVAFRVEARAVDSVARQIDLWAVAEARRARRAREALALERDLSDQVLAVKRALFALHAGDAALAREALAAALPLLLEAAKAAGRMGRDGIRDVDEQRMVASIAREDVRAMRLVPASSVLEPLRRTVREVSGRLGKEVGLRLRGGEVRLDRHMVEELKGPLLHLVRNAIDHGIERPAARERAGKPRFGRLDLTVEPRGARFAIVVEDDGAGIDAERVRAVAVARGVLGEAEAAALPDGEALSLVFRPGFSTAPQVTAISGRGVGLDVVHEAVTRLHGSVALESTRGAGTRFTLDLPVQLAAALAVIVRSGGELLAVPADCVERALRIDLGSILLQRGAARVRQGDRELPYASLARLLSLSRPDHAPEGKWRPALLLTDATRQAVIGVEEIVGHQEIVVSALGRHGAAIRHVSGATALETGQVVPVLNARDVLGRFSAPLPPPPGESIRRRVLVADDALATRAAIRILLESAGYEVVQAVDGEAAMALLLESRCDLVVTDAQMPKMSGIELTRRIKADPALARIPVVLVTTQGSEADHAAVRAAGADGALVKREFTRGKLLDLVRRLAEA